MRLLKEENNKLIDTIVENTDTDKIGKNMWIHLVNPSENEISELCYITKIECQKLLSALDPEEIAHIDYDGDDDLLTFDIPCKNENGIYETVPFIIIANKDYIISICSKETSIIDSLISKVKKIEPHKHMKVTLLLLYRISEMYISALKYIDKKRNELEVRITTSTKNKEIFELMELNKSLIYLSTSLNSNKNVLLKLEKMPEYKQYEDDYDLMDDALLENNQAIEMCSIHRQILDGMLNAFASITSNNLNIVMKILTIITMVISIPTLIGSFYGMNVVGLPIAEVPGAFWIILAFSIVASIVGAYILLKLSDRSIKIKKKKQ